MPRGGRRVQRSIGAYSNRTDMNANAVLTPAAATGQEYGKAGAQLAAQKMIPMAAAPVVASPATTPAGPSAGGGGLSALPGQLPPLDRPTERPDEPLTAGAPFGAGPGPMGPTPADEDLLAFAKYLPALEIAASQPNASATTRNFVRRLRGAMPVDQER